MRHLWRLIRERVLSRVRRTITSALVMLGGIAATITIVSQLPKEIPTSLALLIGIPLLVLVLVLSLLVIAVREDLRWQAFHDRIYHLIASEWSYDVSPQDRNSWSATHLGRRRLTSRVDGLRRLNIQFTKGEDHLLPFGVDCQPDCELVSWIRSADGVVRLAEPHKRTGSTFAFRIVFEPPLLKGETADVEFRVNFPRYKFAYREDLVSATSGSEGGIREHEYNARDIAFPTERLVLSSTIPLDLGPIPEPLEVTRRGVAFDEELRQVLNRGAYMAKRLTSGTRECWLMKLDLSFPSMNATYRIRWRLPKKEQWNGQENH